MAPHTHVSPKAELHCYLCRTPYHSWSQHLYYECVSTALACLHGFKTLASSLQLESPIQWLAVDRISVSIEGSTLHWALVHPATAPGTNPLPDVALPWSGAIAVRPGAALPAGSRDASVRVFLSTIAQWEVLEPLTRKETICCTPNPPIGLPRSPRQLSPPRRPSPTWGPRPTAPETQYHLASPRPPRTCTLPSGALMCAWQQRRPPRVGGSLVQTQPSCALGSPRLGPRHNAPLPRPDLPHTCFLSYPR